jgi:hypothetical protein
MADRWVKRWKVPRSDGQGFWTVAVDKNGVFGCSCPVWKFKRVECHHIIRVKANGGQEFSLKPRPQYVLAQVLKPRYDEARNTLLIPLVVPGGSVGMEATICYYLMKYGYSFKEVRELRGFCVPASWTKEAIFAHVAKHGEAEYSESFYRY